jgi:alcohol-forming fatty acyl-CoA reductase
MSALSSHRFNMETDHIDNKEYMKRTILGGRQYCLKEPLSSLPKARMQLKLLVEAIR